MLMEQRLGHGLIYNNGAIKRPSVNPHNERQDPDIEEPDDGHTSLGEEQAMRQFGVK